MASLFSRHNRYDGVSIAIHWVSAAIVICLWLIGQLSDLAPRGTIREAVWSTHVSLGILLAGLVVVRIIWRLTGGYRLPPAHGGFLGLLATLGHLALYILLIAAVSLGLADAFVREFNIFGIVTLPQIGDPELRRPINGWHELAANVLAGVALLHALAALFHRYVLKDQVLARMGVGL